MAAPAASGEKEPGSIFEGKGGHSPGPWIAAHGLKGCWTAQLCLEVSEPCFVWEFPRPEPQRIWQRIPASLGEFISTQRIGLTALPMGRILGRWELGLLHWDQQSQLAGNCWEKSLSWTHLPFPSPPTGSHSPWPCPKPAPQEPGTTSRWEMGLWEPGRGWGAQGFSAEGLPHTPTPQHPQPAQGPCNICSQGVSRGFTAPKQLPKHSRDCQRTT